MIDKIKQLISGDVDTSDQTREEYSHDTSLFEVVPEAVIYPKDSEDIQKLVKFVNENKNKNPELSITPRSGGTDMTGGSINESLILAMERYMNHIGEVKDSRISVQPGAYYRHFEEKTLEKKKIMPSYPASRSICAVGGMVANNAGGEKSLRYGKTENFVKRLKVVLSDGNEYEFKPIDKKELDKKMTQKDFEGQLYRDVFELVDGNYEEIKAAKPNVTKNSTGYKIWDIWDRETGIFDMTQIIVGSQGTLGLVTDIEFELVDAKEHSGVLVGYANDLEHLGEMVEILLEHNPDAIEAFDEHTLKFAFKFFLQFRKELGWWGLFRLALRFIPDAFLIADGLKLPKMIFMASFESDDYDEINQKLKELEDDIRIQHWHIALELAETEEKSMRFWLMRRKSFKLLRDNVKGRHTAPFIDDLVVPPNKIKDFWPEILEIMERYELLYTIAGHLGDGNFHIIPLMDLTDPVERAKIEPCLKEVMELIKKYDGVISGEHNDGLIRSPFLSDMYGDKVFAHFKRVKEIFDPKNIFNPKKKTDSDWQYSKEHIRDHF